MAYSHAQNRLLLSIIYAILCSVIVFLYSYTQAHIRASKDAGVFPRKNILGIVIANGLFTGQVGWLPGCTILTCPHSNWGGGTLYELALEYKAWWPQCLRPWCTRCQVLRDSHQACKLFVYFPFICGFSHTADPSIFIVWSMIYAMSPFLPLQGMLKRINPDLWSIDSTGAPCILTFLSVYHQGKEKNIQKKTLNKDTT